MTARLKRRHVEALAGRADQDTQQDPALVAAGAGATVGVCVGTTVCAGGGEGVATTTGAGVAAGAAIVGTAAVLAVLIGREVVGDGVGVTELASIVASIVGAFG